MQTTYFLFYGNDTSFPKDFKTTREAAVETARYLRDTAKFSNVALKSTTSEAAVRRIAGKWTEKWGEVQAAKGESLKRLLPAPTAVVGGTLCIRTAQGLVSLE